jgi:beta-N-acetylhexosaminidase
MSGAVGEQTTLAERKRRAGQRIFVGFHGHAVSVDLRKLVREVGPSGFVLFARNVASPEQVRELNRELASLVPDSHPAFLAVDQEGGRVQRIREPATRFPPMRTLGAAKNLTADVSRAMAIELRAMGFNLNFAPVADVDSNPDNPVIGDRSFSRDPKAVGEHVAAFIRAHQAEFVMACAKHFPGHGDTNTDSHHTLPTVDRSAHSLRQTELPPFRAAIAAGVVTIMTSHVVYPAWDETFPATMSETIINGLVRKELGYDGLIFSDDLEMKAVRGRYTAEEQVMCMTRATVDVLLCCDRQDVQMEVFEAAVRAQEINPGAHHNTELSVARLDALRKRAFLLPDGRPIPPPPGLEVIGQHRALVERIREVASR